MMDATTLRCRGDLELATRLLADPFVQEVLATLEREEAETPLKVRRRLLATALRLTPTMMPDVHATIDACRERLGVEIPLEVYVYASADFNAACVKPEEGRLFVLLSSSLLEGFPEGERRFVIGHELGHHLYAHHDIPVNLILQGERRPDPALALRLFAWSRYAEISADRAGAVCVDGSDDVARGLFRLASGLRLPLENVRITEFADQFEDLRAEHVDSLPQGPRGDWFSTHPFSPLRLKAARLFFDSELSGGGGFSRAELEARVQELMSLMEPGYLEEKSPEAESARRLLFAAAIAVANASDGVGEEEIRALEDFLGAGAVTPSMDPDAVTATLAERLADARAQVSHPRRTQLLRDLAVIAHADGGLSEAERDVIVEVAQGLEVPIEIVDQRFCADCDADHPSERRSTT